jgi:bifunctional non-homologous end joining protein LigD
MPAKAAFIEPMLLQPTERLPEGRNWSYELKLDGYRALAVKTAGNVRLRSRNDNDFSRSYPSIVQALAALPDETVIDGEIVALDEAGRPSFSLLQNHSSARVPICYYVFDLLVLAGRDVMGEALSARRDLLTHHVLSKLSEPIRHSPDLQASLADLIQSVREHGLEGLVAKRLDSRYEPGLRSGAWQKMRLNRSEEFVIGGYTPVGSSFDALVFGQYRGADLVYVARTRNGFTPLSRDQLWRLFRGLETADCSFVNLPEKHAGRWGYGLTADKMQQCRWLKPQLIALVEFVEWTPDNHLRHARFVRLRENESSF